MIRWVAFDDDTAEFVVSSLRRGAAEINHSAPIDAALHAAGPAMLVLPASTPGRLLVARFSKRTESPSTSTHTSAPASPRAKKPAVSAPKPWWRRIA
ncbi:MAG TPA: hypothetical protein VK466_00070 [Terriglobales bacterium]|nr:hypothetical protein [Terriglobales bacterium]